MGENVPGEVELAFEEWASRYPEENPYTSRLSDDITIYDMAAAFAAGVEWAVFNVET